MTARREYPAQPMSHDQVMHLLTVLGLGEAAAARGQDPGEWMTPAALVYWDTWRAGKAAVEANYDALMASLRTTH